MNVVASCVQVQNVYVSYWHMPCTSTTQWLTHRSVTQYVWLLLKFPRLPNNDAEKVHQQTLTNCNCTIKLINKKKPSEIRRISKHIYLFIRINVYEKLLMLILIQLYLYMHVVMVLNLDCGGAGLGCLLKGMVKLGSS